MANKLFSVIFFICLSLIIFIPSFVDAQGIVPCDGPDCTIDSFFIMLGNIYRFIVLMIATPLAVIATTIGGILLLISGGNPRLKDWGKKTIWASIIGLVLVFGSYLIIDFILSILEYKWNWSIL